MSTKKTSIRFAALGVALATVITPLATAPAANAATPAKIRIGFFANVTHAPALVALEEGYFKKYLPAGITIVPTLFSSGVPAVEAFKGNALDVSYVGPNPAINGFNGTGGTLLKIVSGAASGGVQFITKKTITTVNDLKGKKIATPGLGNTQDVSLKAWLVKQGIKNNVTVIPTENAQTLTLFKQGKIDGAWVPEPWASRLVLEGNGRVFLDERNLWKNNKFVITQITAKQTFLASNPELVSAVIKANYDAIAFIKANPAKAKQDVQKQLAQWTGKTLTIAALDRAWKNLEFTNDPLASTLNTSAQSAVTAGLLNLHGSLKGIYDLSLENAVLKAHKQATVSAAGLGKQ